MIVDTHCHLTHEDIKDIDGVLDRAAAAGVSIVQTICTSLDEFPKLLRITQTHNNVLCSVGVHPMHINESIIKSEEIIALSIHDKVISIGETGLDYHYSIETKVLQQNAFIAHIEAAQETGLPLIIHARNADEDIVSILQDNMRKKAFKAVIHCFTATRWLAMECIDMGFYISASGIITFKNAEDIRSTFMNIPLDRILIETDAPYLAPAPHRGKKNEPAFLVHTLKFLADMKGVSYSDMATQTTKNFYQLFEKASM